VRYAVTAVICNFTWQISQHKTGSYDYFKAYICFTHATFI